MGPVSGINGGANYQPDNIQPSQSTAADSLRAAGGAGVLGPNSAGGASGSSGVTNVYSGVTELLQSIGGGVENDKLLRMLIALMILMALLDGQQNQSTDNQNALRSLGGGNGGGGQTIGIFSSSTTISIHQTEINIWMGDASAATGDASTGQGSTLDEVA